MAQITVDTQAAPSTPASGKAVIWVDNGTGALVATNATGRHTGSLSRNDTTASQTGFAADQYVTNSGILVPNLQMKAGQLFKWTMDVKKTAAGTAAAIIQVRTGAAQSTGDTSRLTLTADVAQTAAVSTGVLIVVIGVRSVGASGVIAGGFGMCANSPGLGGGAAGASIGFDNTNLAGQYVGLSINGGTSAAWTIQHVAAELIG